MIIIIIIIYYWNTLNLHHRYTRIFPTDKNNCHFSFILSDPNHSLTSILYRITPSKLQYFKHFSFD